MTVTIFEAKTKLSDLVRKAPAGEEIIITSGREKTPVARLQPVEPRTIKRLGARYDPNYKVSEGFWDPLPEEELRLWEGRND